MLILSVQVLDNEANIESMRAAYLLDTLKSRGFNWPELWWQPEVDGGVCSFLGTVDETFDAHATLTTLEAKGEEERLQATAAAINPQVNAKFAAHEAALGTKMGMEDLIAVITALAQVPLGPGEQLSPDQMRMALAAVMQRRRSDVGGSERKTPGQEKRSEAQKETKAKAKDGKQAEN